MASGNTSEMLVTTAIFCTYFIDIAAMTSTSEVQPKAIHRSFKYAQVQTKPEKLQKNCCKIELYTQQIAHDTSC